MIPVCNDTYHTDPRARTWLFWLTRLTRWAFYLPVGEIVVRYSRVASRGRLDDRTWLQSANEVLEVIEAAGMDVHVEGLEHVRALDQPAVFVGNHMSALETFVLPCIIGPHRPVTYVVKESLLRYPAFGPVLRSRNPIVVGRDNPREDLKAVLEGGQERLARGISVIVFPQTTRSDHFDPEQFNSIGAKLAGRAGVPLVPLALRTDAWGNGRRLKDCGPIRANLPVHFRFGAPLRPDRRGAEAHRQTVAFIRKALRECDKTARRFKS